MKFSEDILSKVEKYLDNSLDSSERIALEKLIDDNLELREYVELSRKLSLQYSDTEWDTIEYSKENETLKAYEALFMSTETKTSKQAINKARAIYFKNRTKKIKLIKSLTIGIAASISLFIGLLYFNSWSVHRTVARRQAPA